MYFDVWYQEVLENVSLRKEAREAQQSKDVIVVGEFSEKYGPIALKIIPEQEDSAVQDIENFVVQVMAVDYSGSHAGVPMYQPQDSSMLLKSKRRIAFIHYFTLHDVYARGYARIFTLSYISISVKRLTRNIETLRRTFSTISQLCHNANKYAFYKEICCKLDRTCYDDMEKSQTRWWMQQIEQRHNMEPHISTSPPQRSKTFEDFERYIGVTNVDCRMTRFKSIQIEGEEKKIISYIKDTEKDLRTLQEMCPLEYEFLCRSLQQLYVTSGQSSCLRSVTKKDECLSAARYDVQFPIPSFDRRKCNPLDMSEYVVYKDYDTNDGKQVVGQSQFYTEISYNSDPSLDESLYTGTLTSGVPYNSTFSPGCQPLFTKQGKVNCINPDTVARDLLFFREQLGPAAVHLIYALLSGKTLIILGSDNESRYLLNAVSIFVTRKDRVLHTIKKMFTLSDLTRYSVIQVENNVDILKTVNYYSSQGVCCIVSHDKRSLNAPRYDGTLIQNIWGWYPQKRAHLVPLGENSLLALVQAGLMSLMSNILVLYYTALHNPEAEPDTSDLDECDKGIMLYQLYSTLHHNTPALSTSHSLNINHKYATFEPFRFYSS